MYRISISLAFVFVLAAADARAQGYASTIPANHPAIRYAEVETDDPVARLARKLQSGARVLAFREGGLGYLPELLQALGVPVDSQALVFSKTSFQAAKISPRNPRAVYFTDDVAVGWVRGGDGIELAALDPEQGIVFYTLDAKKQDRPQLARRQECLHCHQGTATLGVPGIFVGSVFPDASGMPSRDAAIITDHGTRFADRWGGWYVNATHGQQADRSNAMASNPAEPKVLANGARNVPDLVREFSATGYLSAVSDIVSLMTFEHQTKVTNLLIRAGWEWRTSGRVAVDELVDYMLFVDEAPLPEPVEGVSTFARTFADRGPCDRHGRSLRQFDLRTRLFRYPLSYMIYSGAFDALPELVRERVYRRLFDVLTGLDTAAKYGRLDAATRSAILSIVADTKPNRPAYWNAKER